MVPFTVEEENLICMYHKSVQLVGGLALSLIHN